MEFLESGGHCLEVKNGGTEEQDTFCTAFDACVIWDPDEEEAKGVAGATGSDSGATDEMKIDCLALTECAWEGMHEHFLGDGVCHDAMPGCYNSKVCNYDGGDCCEDTCHYPGETSGTTEGDSYGDCGQEGYACRDPSSIDCKPTLALDYKEICAHLEEGDDMISIAVDDDHFKEDELLPDCGSSDLLYRLIQFDSWGDGWDATILTLKEHGTDTPIYQGGLTYGSQGTVHVCLTKSEAKCYHVTVENGVWGNEISWELRPLAGGAPVLAAGGSPSDCTVALAGTVDDCPNTCDSTRPDTKIEDPNYKSYKTLESCIEKSCVIQVGSCSQDDSCAECMQESSPEYCFANENFNTLIDCSMCTCTDDRPAYCDAKSSSSIGGSSSGSSAMTHEGSTHPAASATIGSATGGTAVCGPEQTLQGTSSLIKFSECADLDKMMAMITDFDNDNFGMLDLFEECAHTYDEQPMHGGKKAMDCMKILDEIVWGDKDRDSNDDKVFKNAKGEKLPENIGQAIGTLAHHLYHDPEKFCSCSSIVNKETPMCSSFINFKTLLYEAIDVCKSLDTIDCAAWEEFYPTCKKNLIRKYDSVNFENDDQCDYIEDQCGGAGPFPAFRKLDCGGEIAKSAWDFYIMYDRGCLGSTGSIPSPSPPTSPSSPSTSKSTPLTPAPPSTIAKPSSKTTEKKQYKAYGANGATDEKKKEYHSTYNDVEPEDDSSSYSEKKTHHFFRGFFIIVGLAGVGFIFHKKRKENFNYMQFRQLREARNYAGGLNAGGSSYAGVSMSDSCSFEPPTLPPTPSDNSSMI